MLSPTYDRDAQFKHDVDKYLNGYSLPCSAFVNDISPSWEENPEAVKGERYDNFAKTPSLCQPLRKSKSFDK